MWAFRRGRGGGVFDKSTSAYRVVMICKRGRKAMRLIIDKDSLV